MPDLQDNTITQTETTSDGGSNTMPKFRGDSYFFIENGDFTQSDLQRFGVIDEFGFRTTSLVTLTNKKLISICSGQVFIQPQTGFEDTKVNLILKPYRQPINGLSIKYFIYRGLPKSSFVAGSLVADASASGFMAHIHSEFNSLYGTLNPVPQFLAKYIGYPDETMNQDSADLIDAYFYKLSQTYTNETGDITNSAFQFECPMIPAGIHLATVTGEVGLDIVLNAGDFYLENDSNPFQLNLAYARAQSFTLSVTNPTELYPTKLIKENCVRFLDAAAFYGLHAHGGSIRLFQQNTIESADDIYLVIDGFHTKTKQYIYIQGERQRTYNFYDYYLHPDSGHSIKKGSFADNLTATGFGTSSWPLLESTNSANFYLQLITDSNAGAVAFVKMGNLVSKNELGFVRDTNLIQPPSEDENEPIDQNYSKLLHFCFSASGSNALSSFVQMIYEGKEYVLTTNTPSVDPGEEPTEPQPVFLKDLDDVFGLINAKSFYSVSSDLHFPTIEDHNLQLIHFPLSNGRTDVGTVVSKRSEDAIMATEDEIVQRVTYETLLNTLNRKTSQFLKSSNTTKDVSSSSIKEFDPKTNNFYQPEEPYYFKTTLFTDNGQTITGLTLETIDGTIPTKKILGITKEENQQLVDLIANEGLNNVRVYFKEIFKDDLKLNISNEGIGYKVYVLNVVGENLDGKLKLFDTTESIIIYCLDEYAFFSAKYSKNIPFLVNANKLILDVTPYKNA
jgi:hypothetical protein